MYHPVAEYDSWFDAECEECTKGIQVNDKIVEVSSPGGYMHKWCWERYCAS